MADSPPLYGGRSAVMPRGRPQLTSDTSTSLPHHPSADGPLLTRGRSASASLVRVMRTESGHHVPPSGPTRQPDPSSPGNHLPALSLSPSHSPQTLLSLAKPWRSSPSSSLAIEALPRRSIAGECQETTPTSYTTPISSSSLGRSFPNEFFFYSISSFKPQARKTTPSSSKPSPPP